MRSFSVSLTVATVRFRSLLLFFCLCNTWENIRDTHCVIPSLLFDPEKLLLLAIAFFRGSLIDAIDSGLPHTGQSFLNLYRIFITPEPSTC